MPRPSVETLQFIPLLPSCSEVESHHGWPSIADETHLKQTFYTHFRPQIDHILPPETHLSTNEEDYLLAVLYGFYLFNYVVGGQVITSGVNHNRLADWPVTLSSAFDNSACVDRETQRFFIHPQLLLKRRGNHPPNRLATTLIGERPFLSRLFGSLPSNLRAYTSTLEENAILVGLEEAHHLLEVRYSHHPNPGIALSIRDVCLAHDYQREIFDHTEKTFAATHHIRYHSDLDLEYRALTAQAIYAKRYCPQLWNEGGYHRFVTLVKDARRQFLAKT